MDWGAGPQYRCHPPVKRTMSDNYTDSHCHWNLEASTDKRSKDVLHQLDIHLQDNPSIFNIPVLLFKVYVLAFFKKSEDEDRKIDEALKLLEFALKEIGIFTAEFCSCGKAEGDGCETCQGAIGFKIVANTLFGQIYYHLERNTSKAEQYFKEINNLKRQESSVSIGFIDGTRAFALSRLGPNKAEDSLYYFGTACSASKTNTDWLYGHALVYGRLTRQNTLGFGIAKGVTERTTVEKEQYETVLHLDANHTLAKLFLALVLFNENKLEKAEALFNEILADTVNHRNSEVLKRSIVFYRERGNYAKARELIAEAEALNRLDAFLFHQKALVDIDEYRQLPHGEDSSKHLLENALSALKEASNLRNSAVLVDDRIWVLQELGRLQEAVKVCKSFAKKMSKLSVLDVIGFRLGYGKLLVKRHCGIKETTELAQGLDYIKQAIVMSLQTNDIQEAMQEHMDQELEDGLLKNLQEGILLYEECNLRRETVQDMKVDALQNLGWLKKTLAEVNVPFGDDRSALDYYKSAYDHCDSSTEVSDEIRQSLSECYVTCGSSFEYDENLAFVETSVARLRMSPASRKKAKDIKQDPTFETELEEGSSIDYNNLVFHEVIGEGGYGKVNRVTFKQPHQGYKEAAAKRVFDIREEEVKIMSRLDHPNIARLIGLCKRELVGIIVLEYARNGSLHKYLKDTNKDLPLWLQQKWMKESALALQYLHNKDYLHRDIKANNCLLFEDNVLKLCDFGLARELPEDASSALSSQKGTPKYMAPELLCDTDAKYSRFSDIWSYGMLVYEIATRQMPFQGDDPMHVMFVVCEGTKLPTIPPDCPNHFSRLMKCCWKMEPKKRPTIDDILQDFLPEDDI